MSFRNTRTLVTTGLITAILCSAASAQPPGFPSEPPSLPRGLPFSTSPDSGDESADKLSPIDHVRAMMEKAGSEAPAPEDILSAVKEQLGSSDVQQRIEALLMLPEQDAGSADLSQRLNDLFNTSENPFEKMLAATSALRSKLDPENARKLVDTLAIEIDSKDPSVAIQAALGLQSAGTASAPKLMEALGSPNSLTRSLAAESLGVINENDAAEGLIGLLNDDDATVRVAAAKSLGKMSSKAKLTTEMLRELLEQDDQISVRAQAAASLTILSASNETVRASLIEGITQSDDDAGLAIVRAIAGCDADVQQRTSILAAALKEAKPVHASEITGHLVDMETAGLKALYGALDDSNSRYWAVIGLGEFGSQAGPAGNKLATLLAESTPDVQTEILLTLGKISPDASGAIEGAVSKEMASDQKGVRYAATLTAARLNIQGKQTQAQLKTNRGDDDKVLALISAFALAKLNPRSPHYGLDAIKSLQAAVTSGDPRLQPLAKQALADLKTTALSNLPKLP